MALPFPALTYREWAQLAQLMADALSQDKWRVARVRIPERALFPEGFLKNEWILELQSRNQNRAWVVSLRPKRAYLTLNTGLRTTARATRNKFDLQLERHLAGARFRSVEALPLERILLLRFETGPVQKPIPLELYLVFIPALPEAILFEDGTMVARSRAAADPSQVWAPPDGTRAPPEVELRSHWVADLQTWDHTLAQALDAEAFELRLLRSKKAFEESLSLLTVRTGENREAIHQTRRELDWARFGTALKAVLYEPPPIQAGKIRLVDERSPEGFVAPAPEGLSATQLLEYYFKKAKRHRRKQEESESRVQAFTQKLASLRPLRAELASLERQMNQQGALPWSRLEQVEKTLNLNIGLSGSEHGKGKKKGPQWLGKRFFSKEGLALLVGRSRDENLELTFKVARGNDIWLHLKGRPGAHVVIVLQSGRSASLDTLLDACQLVLHYSKGCETGKFEIDYTPRKYVKRIKDSKEVSYTHNKTLMVSPDKARIAALMTTANEQNA